MNDGVEDQVMGARAGEGLNKMKCSWRNYIGTYNLSTHIKI